MSGKVVDFPKRREDDQKRRDDSQQRLAESVQRRLDDAPDIRYALWTTARTEKQDRAIFAANLARMCVEATRDDKTSIREIFRAAFGKDFDSKYKKLKRFVCAQEEEPPKEGFAAHGADFVALAEAVASIAHAGQTEDAIAQARKRAILQLIEGSSFDDKRLPEARREDEAVGALQEWQDQILQKIKEDVDLDMIYDAVEHASAWAVIDADGNTSRLSRSAADWHEGTYWIGSADPLNTLNTYRFSLLHPAQQDLYKALRDRVAPEIDRQDDLVASQLLNTVGPNDVPFSVGVWNLDEPLDPDLTRKSSDAPFAPRVVLGAVLSPVKRDVEGRGLPGTRTGVVMLDIDEKEIGDTLAQQAHDYDAAVNRHDLTGTAPAFNRHGALRDLLNKAAVKALAARIGLSEHCIAKALTTFEVFDKLIGPYEDNKDKGLKNLLSTEPELEIVTRRQIEIKLMRDKATRHWRPCIALSRGVLEFFRQREGVYGVKRGGSFEPSFTLDWNDDAMISEYAMCDFFLHRIHVNRFMVYGVVDAGGMGVPDLPTGPEDSVFGIETGWLPLLSSPAIDALFANIIEESYFSDKYSIGSHTILAPLGQYADEYAPAKPNTLAGMILRNHAYAPPEERYGVLLLEDARRKAAMTRDFIEQRMKGFEAGMKRPWKTDAVE